MKLINVINASYTNILSITEKNTSKSKDKKIRCAFLRDITIEPLVPFFKYQCLSKGIEAEVFINEYDNIMQEVLDDNSNLYSFNPNIIFLFTNLNRVAPKLESIILSKNMDDINNVLLEASDYYERIITSIRKKSESNIVICNLALDPYPIYGISDIQNPYGYINSIKSINSKISLKSNLNKDVNILDINLLISRIGYNNFFDKRNYHLSKNPFSTNGLRYLAFECVKYISSLKSLSKKCIVLDCDNTLWGGVIGEDGLENILCGDNHPGSYFKNFQKKLIQLKNSGILLAISSKNNLEDVLEVFLKHPEVILSKDDFVSIKVNWNEKSKNIIEISQELNICLDHIIFVDDSEFEIEMVNKTLPEVDTVLVPKDLSSLESIFDYEDFFNSLNSSTADKDRTSMYLAEKERARDKKISTNIQDYFNELNLVTRSSFAKEIEIQRVVQLTQKTNQFNLTTKRYNQSEVEYLIKSDHSDIITIEAEDKYGKYGLIGLAILKFENKTIIIDSFLMSCRALGRGIEKVLLDDCLKLAKKRKSVEIIGQYLQTEKNKQVQNFYIENGFKLKSQNNNKTFEYNLTDFKTERIIPRYIVAKKK